MEGNAKENRKADVSESSGPSARLLGPCKQLAELGLHLLTLLPERLPGEAILGKGSDKTGSC